MHECIFKVIFISGNRSSLWLAKVKEGGILWKDPRLKCPEPTGNLNDQDSESKGDRASPGSQ